MCKKHSSTFKLMMVFLCAMIIGGCSSDPEREREQNDVAEVDASNQDVEEASDTNEVSDARDTETQPVSCTEVACGTNAQCAEATGLCECNDGFSGNPNVGDVEPAKLDILWMIDNSGSMCQEQKALRDNFGEFIATLSTIDIDFHIGITTTHAPAEPAHSFEPVALPGHLQVKPQPLPGFDRSCFYKIDANGQPMHDAPMEPILDAIRTAVACTKDPAAYASLLDPDMDQLRCTFDSLRWRSTLGCTDFLTPESFFPNASDYRDVAQGRKYLRSEDYRKSDNTLDVARLQADFACASLVGTRGDGFEKGLSAIVQAVSPELTGGPDGDPAEFPNAGFLRPDARTGIVIVSDENDCSHDGTLSETHTCGSAICEMAENWEPSPLISVNVLKDSLMENLKHSKGVGSVWTDDVFVASIHGTYQPYPYPGPSEDSPSSPDSLDECEISWSLPPSCTSLKGTAYSGHRYDAFMRQFASIYPSPPSSNPTAPVRGLICEDFSWAFVDIANLFRVNSGGCMQE